MRFTIPTTRQETPLNFGMYVITSSYHLCARPPLLTPLAGESCSNVDLESPELQRCWMMLAFEQLAMMLVDREIGIGEPGWPC